MLAWLCIVLYWLVQVDSTSNFTLPVLPISKANATNEDCRVEIIFVLDVSGSVAPDNQQTMMRFVVQVMMAIEANVQSARFGVVVFGIHSYQTTTSQKFFDSTAWGGDFLRISPPYGNNALNGATELLLGLDSLHYNCTECVAIGKPAWSQLEMMYTVSYGGDNTPTWDGLNYSQQEFLSNGNPSVSGRFVILITDGVPNNGGSNGGCVAPAYDPTDCGISINKTNAAADTIKNGSLLMTVGMNLDNHSQPFMNLWASDPKDVLAVPSTDYSQLANLIPKFLAVMCPKGTSADCLKQNVTSLNISSPSGFLNTGNLYCRFFRDNEAPTPTRTTKGIYVNVTLITCPLPANDDLPSGEWNVEFTLDGRGYYSGARFKTADLCSSAAPTGAVSPTAVNFALPAFPRWAVNLILMFSLFVYCW